MSRTQLGFLAVVVVVATRLVIGWHFFKEGTNKLAEEDWSAAPVLSQAKGPFAGIYTSLTPQRYALLDSLEADAASEEKLDDKTQERIAEWRSEMEERYGLDFSSYTIEPILETWWYERENLGDHYNFGDAELENTIGKQRGETRKVVIALRDKRRAAFAKLEGLQKSLLTEEALQQAAPEKVKANDQTKAEIAKLRREYEKLHAEFREHEDLYKQQERQILTLRNQHAEANAVINAWKEQLGFWIAENYEELKEYFEYKKRVAKNSANPTRQEVATLEGQAGKIEADMTKKAAPLAAGIATLWDGFGDDLNGLAVATQTERDDYRIARPDQAPARLATIDKVIPWFDTIIGALLILGLFTRPAAIAAAGFLLSVILMQPPWIDGTVPTYYQAVEMFALLVLAAVGAGRYAGLDFFLRCLYYRVFPPKSEQMVRYESQRPGVVETVETSEHNAHPITA